MSWSDESGDIKYYIDLDELYNHIQIGKDFPDGKLVNVEKTVIKDKSNEVITSTEVYNRTYGGEISSIKYEVIMRLLDYLTGVDIDKGDPGDVKNLLSDEDAIVNSTFSNKIIINTLLHFNILKTK